jgi:hypothetical protein
MDKIVNIGQSTHQRRADGQRTDHRRQGGREDLLKTTTSRSRTARSPPRSPPRPSWFWAKSAGTSPPTTREGHVRSMRRHHRPARRAADGAKFKGAIDMDGKRASTSASTSLDVDVPRSSRSARDGCRRPQGRELSPEVSLRSRVAVGVPTGRRRYVCGLRTTVRASTRRRARVPPGQAANPASRAAARERRIRRARREGARRRDRATGSDSRAQVGRAGGRGRTFQDRPSERPCDLVLAWEMLDFTSRALGSRSGNLRVLRVGGHCLSPIKSPLVKTSSSRAIACWPTT